ncbi:MAG TPA: hypothetical protein VJP41_07145 [Gaiellaceae bacterium]|nr:hypothetical protein [Gaiellaceae bacterium]
MDGEIDAVEIASRAGGSSWAIGIAPVPAGHPLGGTTAVGADDASAPPEAFFAVTVTRSV